MLLSCSSCSTIHNSFSSPILWNIFPQHWSCCCQHIDLHTALNDFASYTHYIFAICWPLPGWVPCVTVFTFVLPFVHSGCCMVLLLHVMSHNIKDLSFCYVIDGWFCALSASTLSTHNNTYSLMVTLVFADVANSLRISSIIWWSLSPLMCCSVSNLSYSLYWHSTALVLSLPIHAWADSLFLMCILQYFSDITILLCCSLNLLHYKEALCSFAFLCLFLSKCLY